MFCFFFLTTFFLGGVFVSNGELKILSSSDSAFRTSFLGSFGSSFLGSSFLGSSFFGSSFLSSSFLGSSFFCSSFLGSSFFCSSFLGSYFFGSLETDFLTIFDESSGESPFETPLEWISFADDLGDSNLVADGFGAKMSDPKIFETRSGAGSSVRANKVVFLGVSFVVFS